MSLLGRLEDLSLTDIIQIVFLSRRTGVLEIIDDSGRHTVLFRHGLVVNAASPAHPDLLSYLASTGAIAGNAVPTLRKMEDSGIPHGTAAVEMNLINAPDLAAAVRMRILDVVTPLLASREGEFNFILSESMSALDIEYDPDALFKEGGFAPQKIFGSGEGEKIKPLRGLEQSLKAGKALLRGSTSENMPGSLNLGLGQAAPSAPSAPRATPPAVPPPPPKPPAVSPAQGNVVPFLPRDASEPPAPPRFTPIEEPEPAAERPNRPAQESPSGSQFKVAGGLFDIESPEAAYRNVVLFERNPLIRVAARRAFTQKNAKIFQYGSFDDVRQSITELFRSNSFFVTFLELPEAERGNEGHALRLMQQIKHRNPRLPVVIVDSEADLRRRHDLLRAGADLYLTKPSAARLQPGLAEEELSLFADEMVLFAERAFGQWEQLIGGYGVEAGRHFYEMGDQENIDRSFNVLRQLINELSNPNDISQVSATILHLSAEYLDRGALFVVSDQHFVGLGGFGRTGHDDDMSARVRRLRLPRGLPSVLADVANSGEAHHGKMRRTVANVDLIESLGGMLPSEVVALPIMHMKRTIGILYGDNAEHRAPIDSMTGLEIFLSQAGYAFGNAVFASGRGGKQ